MYGGIVILAIVYFAVYVYRWVEGLSEPPGRRGRRCLRKNDRVEDSRVLRYRLPACLTFQIYADPVILLFVGTGARSMMVQLFW